MIFVYFLLEGLGNFYSTGGTGPLGGDKDFDELCMDEIDKFSQSEVNILSKFSFFMYNSFHMATLVVVIVCMHTKCGSAANLEQNS